MEENKNKSEPKKIKMPPLVDRSVMYDTMSWIDVNDVWIKPNEDYNKNNSESIQQLESDETH